MPKGTKTIICSMCDEQPVRYPKVGVCHGCYQFVRYWKNKSVREIVKRQATLSMWSARTQRLVPQKAKVIPIRRKVKVKAVKLRPGRLRKTG